MNTKSKIQFSRLYVKPLFFICICLCLLFLFILINMPNMTEASSIVTPSNHTVFSKSFCITDNMVISTDITPSHPAHYYYVELTKPASVSLQFSHSKEGRFQFSFQSLNESIKYTAKTGKSSYNWTIQNLAAGRYYLTVSCSFYSCTEEQYTLSCSYQYQTQTRPLPISDNDSADSKTDSFAAPPSSSAESDTAAATQENTSDDGTSLLKNKKDKERKKGKEREKASKKKTLKKEKILMRSLQLQNHKKCLYINHSLQLKFKIRPKHTTNQSLRFFSSDTSIASVSKQGCVSARKKGRVTITVKSVDGSHLYATYILKVKNQKPSSPDILPPADPSNKPLILPKKNKDDDSDKKSISASSIRLSVSALTLHIKKSAYIQASVFPSNAESKELHWKSLNPKTATVRNGKVTANASGITTIIVSLKNNPSIRASCTITVKATAP